ncbi:MAG TPA: CPBP family intramembrane glutamic endopeptidase, partial [Blastocatellia bacterium]|nr:CPBP family intramembrane glutamic endopeptidase [Blastocatellia bacterium]
MAEGIEVLHTLFLNRENELRSGWRVLAFALLFLAMLLTIEGLLSSLGAVSPRMLELTQEPSPSVPTSEVRVLSVGISRAIMLVVALAASAICARVLEHRSFGSIGYRFHAGWKRDFLLGLLLGTASLAFVVLISYAAGAVAFSVLTSDPGLWLKRFLILAFVFLVGAAYEEVLTRGFAFQALHHNLGAIPALLITSTAFGLLHLG